MSSIPENLQYSETHEWVQINDGVATVGITDHAQEELTDIVYVELPEVGRALAAGDPCAAVDSAKTFSDVNSPVAGEVIEVNSLLADEPGTVNQSPYENGWFIKVRVAEEADLSHLKDSAQYAAAIGEA